MPPAEILRLIDVRWETLTLPETKAYAKKDYELIKEHFEQML